MNADGSGKGNLTNHPGFDSHPTWSPDGRKVAYVSFENQGLPSIYVHELATTQREKVSSFKGINGAPDWSPRSRVPSNGHLLFVGTLAPRKNVNGLLDAYELLLSRRQDIPDLVIVGTKPDEALWKTRLKRSPLAGRVRCPGYVDRATLKALYTDALVLVMPSLDEGFGIPALEAMTIGVPVIAAARGALPEVVGDAGLLVDPLDVSALAAALERMLSDDQLRDRLSVAGRARTRRFSWRASADALIGAYGHSIERRREPANAHRH